MKRGIISWIWMRTKVYLLAVHVHHTLTTYHSKPDMPTEMLTHTLTNTHTQTDTQTDKC